MAFEIVKPGLSTTVQDLGRPGYYHLGIPESGGMDKFSLRRHRGCVRRTHAA
jgi:allophanate hydrolase subunit 2